MSKQSRAAQARTAKRNDVKKARQQGDKAVRQALDTMSKVESQLKMHNYEGFFK